MTARTAARIRFPFALAVAASACLCAGAAGAAEQKDEKKGGRIIIYDFACGQGDYGAQISDTLRLRLARHGEYDVVDRLTTQDFSEPFPIEAPREKVVANMDKMGVNLAIYGTVTKDGPSVRAEVRCIDLRNKEKSVEWTHSVGDDTERARGEIARMIVEKLRGEAEWVPPQYGDEEEPTNFGPPVNRNGSFEQGHLGWDPPDNVSTFIEKGPPGRGNILRVRTDLAREAWLEYTRALRLGLAKPNNPPHIPTDTSYGSVAGLEGVHYRSEWIKSLPGQRFWMACDAKGGGKIFVKGYRDFGDRPDGLSELSLVQRKMTAQSFARLSEAQQRRIMQEDAKTYPERYRRECYRWYLNLTHGTPIPNGDGWQHHAAPVPPRGGMPDNVQYIQVQIYSYWPPGTYLWDNVHLYKDPRQKAPLAVEGARTPNFGKTSDLIERMDELKAQIARKQKEISATPAEAAKRRELTGQLNDLKKQMEAIQKEIKKYQDDKQTN